MWSSVETGGPNLAVSSAPCARAKHSATLLGGYVYVLAGRGSGGAVPLRDFWRYSLAMGRWEKLESRGDPPPSLQDHTVTAHESKLYVFGGEAGALSNETPLWIYDTETQTWRKLPSLSSYTTKRRGSKDPRCAGVGPRGRRGHSAHALKDCLLIYGGYKDLRGSTNELWAFHYETETWQQIASRGVGPAGPARHRHAATLHAAGLYVHGGQCDLHDTADLWHYDTLSRLWRQVRTPARLCPSARSGHAGLRAGAHFYIFGGETHGHSYNDLWRFHFATETWERIVNTMQWPSPRVDSRAVLVSACPPRVRSAPPAQPRPASPTAAVAPLAPPSGFLREISKLSSFHMRRAARCSYTVLSAERDSTESLARRDPAPALSKSRSAHMLDRRRPADGEDSPREGDEPPASVQAHGPAESAPLPKSASVRFAVGTTLTDEEDAELSTSDYASAERVDGGAVRVVGAAGALGFSNPHYLGGDVRRLGTALTPDSGLGTGDIELRDLAERRDHRNQLHLLLVGGREPPHLALLQSPLSMWTYRLL